MAAARQAQRGHGCDGFTQQAALLLQPAGEATPPHDAHTRHPRIGQCRLACVREALVGRARCGQGSGVDAAPTHR
eukprot:4146261-Prymnesium_polylepis.1